MKNAMECVVGALHRIFLRECVDMWLDAGNQKRSGRVWAATSKFPGILPMRGVGKLNFMEFRERFGQQQFNLAAYCPRNVKSLVMRHEILHFLRYILQKMR